MDPHLARLLAQGGVPQGMDMTSLLAFLSRGNLTNGSSSSHPVPPPSTPTVKVEDVEAFMAKMEGRPSHPSALPVQSLQNQNSIPPIPPYQGSNGFSGIDGYPPSAFTPVPRSLSRHPMQPLHPTSVERPPQSVTAAPYFPVHPHQVKQEALTISLPELKRQTLGGGNQRNLNMLAPSGFLNPLPSSARIAGGAGGGPQATCPPGVLVQPPFPYLSSDAIMKYHAATRGAQGANPLPSQATVNGKHTRKGSAIKGVPPLSGHFVAGGVLRGDIPRSPPGPPPGPPPAGNLIINGSTATTTQGAHILVPPPPPAVNSIPQQSGFTGTNIQGGHILVPPYRPQPLPVISKPQPSATTRTTNHGGQILLLPHPPPSEPNAMESKKTAGVFNQGGPSQPSPHLSYTSPSSASPSSSTASSSKEEVEATRSGPFLDQDRNLILPNGIKITIPHTILTDALRDTTEGNLEKICNQLLIKGLASLKQKNEQSTTDKPGPSTHLAPQGGQTQSRCCPTCGEPRTETAHQVVQNFNYPAPPLNQIFVVNSGAVISFGRSGPMTINQVSDASFNDLVTLLNASMSSSSQKEKEKADRKKEKKERKRKDDTMDDTEETSNGKKKK